MSLDGQHLAVGTDEGREAVIWVYDLAGGSAIRRLTLGGRNRYPVWSSDGQRIAFQSDRDKDLAIWWQRADGTGMAERLTKPDPGTEHVPDSMSPRGDRLLDIVKDSAWSLWTLSLPDKTLTPFGNAQSRFPTAAVFSPNGQWVAYATTEQAGQPDIRAAVPSGWFAVRDPRKSWRPTASSLVVP
ncbi:MAG TPA: hypothetical protein VGX46_16480 [Vicinamibacterales bacterium]|nr:hypothetical protein [Vicinamibacterales bacterium]